MLRKRKPWEGMGVRQWVRFRENPHVVPRGRCVLPRELAEGWLVVWGAV